MFLIVKEWTFIFESFTAQLCILCRGTWTIHAYKFILFLIKPCPGVYNFLGLSISAFKMLVYFLLAESDITDRGPEIYQGVEGDVTFFLKRAYLLTL